MSSSKVPEKLTDTVTATATEQAPSILNNIYVKIGGGVFIFFIFVIILYYISKPSPEKIVLADKIEKTKPEVKGYNVCSLYPKCNFNSIINMEEALELKIKYPDINITKDIPGYVGINDNIIIMPDNAINSLSSIGIKNSTDQKFPDCFIKSIISEGYNIKLYSKPNFEGDEKTFTGKISIECFDNPFRSAKIDREIQI
jgi:hypothetical protein